MIAIISFTLAAGVVCHITIWLSDVILRRQRHGFLVIWQNAWFHEDEKETQKAQPE